MSSKQTKEEAGQRLGFHAQLTELVTEPVVREIRESAFELRQMIRELGESVEIIAQQMARDIEARDDQNDCSG